MQKTMAFLAGMGAGAMVMYMLDPQGGRRRRRLAADQAVHAAHMTGDTVEGMSRDAANRARGMAAETQARAREGSVDDPVLVERVRAEIGHAIAHPGGVEVSARDGAVTLRGPVLAGEVQDLVTRVRGVRGVRQVDNQLTVHQRADGVPSLQGDTARRG
jgi:osmotically-inducible protein OsmY